MATKYSPPKIFLSNEHSTTCRANRTYKAGRVKTPFSFIFGTRNIYVNGQLRFCVYSQCGDAENCDAEIYMLAEELANFLNAQYSEQP